MSDDALRALAARAGVLPRWRDAFDREQDVSPDVLRDVLGRIGLPAATDADMVQSSEKLDQIEGAGHLPPLVTADVGAPATLPVKAGRYRLDFEGGGFREGVVEDGRIPAVDVPGYHRLTIGDDEAILAFAPNKCFSIEAGARPWGLAVQLYSLRRKGDGGVGDFVALEEMARAAARLGASALAISPVHAQFSADPDRFGPYAPSSRIMLNVLHAPLPDGAEPYADLSALPLVDWPAAGRARLAAFRKAFEADPDPAGFAAFRAELGDALESHARFEALHAHLFGRDPARWHWRDWPDEFRDPAHPAVAAFARDNAREVTFHEWMQFRADAALGRAQQAARAAKMSVGLISDLAVGTDSGGSHCWSRQDQVLQGLTVGAPPDLLSPHGQNWGIVAFSPLGLRAHGFGAFIEMLRAALRHAGGLRIDHVMGLARLWVVPDGGHADHGAYLTMPRTDLLRLVALESIRHRAVVLGEDLGTLPEGFQGALSSHALRGLRVLWFERAKDQGFIAPRDWTPDAVAMTSTHDLPTLAGWWKGHDLDLRAGVGQIGDEAAERAARVIDRERLWRAFQASGAATADAPVPAMDEASAMVDAGVAHVGRAACGLVLLPIEDAIGTVEQPNLPGTLDEHPNWRRRLPAPSEQLLSEPGVERRLAILRQSRTPVS